jgi:pyrimidine-nucleoside phosphorylase
MFEMTPYEIITKKRDAKCLAEEEINYFVQRYLTGDIKDYQVAALLMAIFLNGMNDEESCSLTKAYLRSGEVIDLSDIPGPKVDKHSTGGVGDKVSIILAPLAASLGIIVPMISGRGLGHTGGTLDKLESIPGFRTYGSLEDFKDQLLTIGVAMYRQTDDFVPADRKIYALRDVTATVGSIPLIIASILSKKIAEGIDSLVLDVKYGNGSFTPSVSQATFLAEKLIKIGKIFDKKVVAYLSAMDQPLGNSVGNWLEVLECLKCLAGKGPKDVMEIVIQLTSEMLLLAGKETNMKTAREKCLNALQNGKAFEKFLELVRFQKGEERYILEPENNPLARYRYPLIAWEDGYVAEIDTRQIGMISGYLGAGRLRAGDTVDAQAGMIFYKKLGDTVQIGEPLLEIHTNDKSLVDSALHRLKNAIQLAQKKQQTSELILKRID